MEGPDGGKGPTEGATTMGEGLSYRPKGWGPPRRTNPEYVGRPTYLLARGSSLLFPQRTRTEGACTLREQQRGGTWMGHTLGAYDRHMTYVGALFGGYDGIRGLFGWKIVTKTLLDLHFL